MDLQGFSGEVCRCNGGFNRELLPNYIFRRELRVFRVLIWEKIVGEREEVLRTNLQ